MIDLPKGAAMLQLDRAALRRALPWGDLVAALDAMFREGCEAPLRHRHTTRWHDLMAQLHMLPDFSTYWEETHFDQTDV